MFLATYIIFLATYILFVFIATLLCWFNLLYQRFDEFLKQDRESSGIHVFSETFGYAPNLINSFIEFWLGLTELYLRRTDFTFWWSVPPFLLSYYLNCFCLSFGDHYYGAKFCLILLFIAAFISMRGLFQLLINQT